MERLDTIVQEFHKDNLRRDPRCQYGGYQVSINGEFPESGLVPLTFVTDILGIHPAVDGLEVNAKLPADMTFAGIRAYYYCNEKLQIEVSRTITEPEVVAGEDCFTVKLPADQTWYIVAKDRTVRVRAADGSSDE